MQDFVQRQVDRTNRNFGMVNVLGLLACVAFVLSSWQYNLTVLNGPKQVLLVDELRIQPSDFPGANQILTVHGDEAADSGFYIETTTRDKNSGAVTSVQKSAYYSYIFIGKSILVVKSLKGGAASTATGLRANLPPDLRDQIIASVPDKRAELKEALLPQMLDTTDIYSFKYLELFLILPLTALTAANVLRWLARVGDHQRHPIIRRLSLHGESRLIQPVVDADFRNERRNRGRPGLCLAQDWMAYQKFYSTQLRRYDEFVWVHKKATKHSVNFIPTRTSFAVLLYSKFGDVLEVATVSESSANEFLETIARRTPWIIFGYDKELSNVFKKNRPSFVQAVDQRRAAWEVHQA